MSRETGGDRGRDTIGVDTWALLLRTHAALVPRLSKDLEAANGLPLSWYDVLLELNAAPGRRLRMQEVGNRVVLSRSQASRVVDELARAGLVRREPDPGDRRAAYAVLTDEGRAAFRSAAPIYLAGIAEHFTNHLTNEELRVLQTALTRVLNTIETAERGAPATPASGTDDKHPRAEVILDGSKSRARPAG